MSEYAVAVYTDGACKSNGTRAAVGGVGVYWGPDDPRNVSRSMGASTNNICELVAIQAALETIMAAKHDALDPTRYVVYSDSKYAIQCLTTWYAGFVRRNWLTAAGTPVKNKELIVDIHRKLIILGERVVLQYVKGHAGNVGNEAADALAVAACVQ